MSENPLVTVLMPVYNSDKYLAEAIDSILNQTYSDFEFIIVNDGSDDDSEQIILSYKDSRINYLKNQENLGIVASLNIGIDVAKGKYIVRMDSDDISLLNRLQIQINFMDENPNIGVCGGFIKLFGNEDSVWKVPLENEEIKATLLFENAFCHPATIIRTSLLKDNKLKYRFTYPHKEDYDLWYRMQDYTDFANIDQIVLYYRYEGQNITIKNKATKQQRARDISLELKFIFQNIILLVQKYGINLLPEPVLLVP
jgi:glycosyltransferase involved in cell wall biosynthesis